MTNFDLRIKRDIYDKLIAYLEAKANSEPQAKSLVEQLKTQAKPSYQLPSGAYLLDGNNGRKYKIN